MFVDRSVFDQSLHTGLYILVTVLLMFSVAMILLFGIRDKKLNA